MRRQNHQCDIVAIGGSAGGLESLCKLLEALPANLHAIVLVVLHRPVERDSRLKEILSRHTALGVEIAVPPQKFRHGICYIGQPSDHLMVGPGLRAELLEDHFYRGHSIDALFNSLALHAGSRTIGVVLSGLLKDGAVGLAAIKAAGGKALVQSPQEARYGDMPRAAAKFMGIKVDLIGNLDALAAAICGYVQIPRGGPD
jgi:two-component system chemotaxis response regulator CheB